MKPTPIHLIPATFWAKVERRTAAECWPWLAGKQQDGYGMFRGKPAHRWAYMLTHGDIAPGMQVDHMCHNRGCVNPAHLRELTRERNQLHRKGANRTSTTGVLGVCMSRGRFLVRVSGRYGGTYGTLDAASDAAAALRARLIAAM